ncbi:MAG: hypothetical protein ACI8SJ_002663 [Shewanella sp.]|jgi:hypothetical protein
MILKPHRQPCRLFSIRGGILNASLHLLSRYLDSSSAELVSRPLTPLGLLMPVNNIDWGQYGSLYSKLN